MGMMYHEMTREMAEKISEWLVPMLVKLSKLDARGSAAPGNDCTPVRVNNPAGESSSTVPVAAINNTEPQAIEDSYVWRSNGVVLAMRIDDFASNQM